MPLSDSVSAVDCVKAAYKAVFTRLPEIGTVVAWPLIGNVAVFFLMRAFVDEIDDLTARLLYGTAASYFDILIAGQLTSWWLQSTTLPRIWLTLRYPLGWVFVGYLAVTVFDELKYDSSLKVFLLPPMMVIIWLGVRFSFLFPVVAEARQPALTVAWQIGRGSFWWTVVVVLLSVLPLALLMVFFLGDIEHGPRTPFWAATVDLGSHWLATAIFSIAIAEAYRRAGGSAVSLEDGS